MLLPPLREEPLLLLPRELPLERLDLDEELLLFFTDPELRPVDLLPLLLFERGFTELPLEPELLRR